MHRFPSTGTLRLLSFCLFLLCCSGCQACAHGACHEELRHVNEQLNASPNDGPLLIQRDWQVSLTDSEKAGRGSNAMSTFFSDAQTAGTSLDPTLSIH